MHRWFESVREKMPKWEPAADRGLWPLCDPRLSNPSQGEEEVLLCREKNLGQYSSLSPFPAHHSHTTNITLSKIKSEKLYFYKEMYLFVHWSSYIMFDYVSAYICITAIQQYEGHCWRSKVRNHHTKSSRESWLANRNYNHSV